MIDSTIDLQEGGVNLLIIRYDLEIKLIELPLDEFHFLHALQERLTISEALEATLHINTNFKLEKKLLGWLKNKTIVGFHL
jgi:hypothetical protein